MSISKLMEHAPSPFPPHLGLAFVTHIQTGRHYFLRRPIFFNIFGHLHWRWLEYNRMVIVCNVLDFNVIYQNIDYNTPEIKYLFR